MEGLKVVGDLKVEGSVDSRYLYLDGKIKESMRRSAQEVVRLGCYLRCMLEEGAWRLHHGTFDGYLRQELSMERTMANRFIAANKKYSVAGTVRLDERWEGYSPALLIEMLNVPPELETRITPDMTVREVRELKRQAAGNVATSQRVDPGVVGSVPEASFRELGPVGDVATSQRVDPGPGGPVVPVPEGWSLDDAPEIEDALRHEECRLRDYARLEAGGVFLSSHFRQRLTVAAMRAFLQGLRAGLQPGPQPDPVPGPQPELEPVEPGSIPGPGEGSAAPQLEGMPSDDLERVKNVLKDESGRLDRFLAAGDAPEKLLFRQKTIVAALAGMVCELDGLGPAPERQPGPQPDPVPEPVPQPQPELPRLKNDVQRREWIANYKAWGLWYRDEHVGIRYYKYDFENGARLVVEAYPDGGHDFYVLHLVGGPEPPRSGYGVYKWSYHRTYCRYDNSVTEVVEFLKYLQKKK